MSIIYLDTSALLKRYVQESGTEALKEAWPAFQVIGSAVIVQVEMASALAKAGRLGWLISEEAQHAWDVFLEDLQMLTLVAVNAQVVQLASELAWVYELRGYDATHMAAALVWQRELGETVSLGTFDRQLWNAGQQAGMGLWPENLDQFSG